MTVMRRTTDDMTNLSSKKMKEEIIIAGFGGQGVLSMGKILAYSAIMQDMEVTWMPSYILSDKKIGSPIVTKYDTAIILNQQSMDKFEQTVKPGGWLVYDPSGITRHPSRTDINICRIDAIEGAARIGNSKVYNMVVLGGFLAVKPIVSLENVEKGLGKSIPARYSSLIPMNKAAIEDGMKHVEIVNRI